MSQRLEGVGRRTGENRSYRWLALAPIVAMLGFAGVVVADTGNNHAKKLGTWITVQKPTFVSDVAIAPQACVAPEPHPGNAPLAAPPNDDCAGAVVIPSSGPFPYDTAPVDVTDATPQDTDEGLSDACSALNGGTPIDRTVWFSFTPDVAGLYGFDSSYCVVGGGAAADNLFDSVITVMDSEAGACPTSSSSSLACDDASGSCNCYTDSCGISGAPYTDQANVLYPLVAGHTYFIVIGDYTGAFTPGFGNVQLQVTYHNPPSNDTCASPTPLALDRVTLGTTAGGTNDYRTTTPGGAAVNTACFTGVGQTPTSSNGIDVVFSFVPPSTDRYSFRYVQDDSSAALRGQNPVLYLADDCPDPDPTGTTPPHCIAAANRLTDQSDINFAANDNRGEEIHCVQLTGGTSYYLFFDDRLTGNAGGDLGVEVTRCRDESEPNDTIATATPFVPNSGCFMEGSSIASGAHVCSGNHAFGCNPVASGPAPTYNAGCLVCSGSAAQRCLADADCSSLGLGTCSNDVGTCTVSVTGDVDFYDLGAPPAGSKIFVGMDAAASTASDYEMRITTATDTLGYDDQDSSSQFGRNAPEIGGVIAPGGEVYARINSVPFSAGNEPYRLYRRFETGAPQPETLPDTTPDLLDDLLAANPLTGGGFVRGTMGTANDTDCWKFLAHEGDNIVMFTDNNPFRAPGNIEENVWPTLVTIDRLHPSDDVFGGQILRNILGTSPGTLTGTSPSVTTEFMQHRARYTGAYAVCYTETSGADNGYPTGTHPLAYQGSASINCGPIAVWGTEHADVSVTKTGPASPVNTGSIVSYTITVKNNDATGIAEDIRLTDTLPSGLVYVSLDVDDGFGGGNTQCLTLPTPGQNDAPIDCTNFSLTPGASATYTLTVQVANCLGAGNTIVNSSSITTRSTDSNSLNDSASWSFTTGEDGTCLTLLCNPGGCIPDACAVGNTCDANHVCQSQPRDCDDHSLCTLDSCDPTNAAHPCINDSSQQGDLCYDGNDCTFDRCDPVLFCVFPPTAAGGSCSDFLNCTLNDACDGNGNCVGHSVCDDGQPCTDDFADEANNCACDNPISFPGSVCEDGNACIVGTTCDGLGGAAADCNGGHPADCNDNNPCTDDSCDTVLGCVHVNNSDPCGVAGSNCTTGDVCSGGICVPSGPRNCDDGNCCTTDSCDPAVGCVHTADLTPPVFTTQPSLGDTILWSPNHGYVDFTTANTGAAATSSCGSASIQFASCSSSQPDNSNGTGDGNTTRDCVYAPDVLSLRAERDGACSPIGRVYESTVIAVDACGRTATSNPFDVVVWHDRAHPPTQGTVRFSTGNSQDTRAGTTGTYGTDCGLGSPLANGTIQDHSDADPEMEIAQNAALDVNDLQLAKNGGSVQLTWNSPVQSGQVTRYHVWRLDPLTLFWTQIAEVTRTTTTYSDPVLSNAAGFQYKISAVIK
jgi:uncharacterized repeat protein (TIGR01451 family)